MIKILTLLIAICLIACGCDNPAATDDNADKGNTAKQQAEIAALNDVLKKYEQPSQRFKVSASKPGTVKGRKGTKISINPSDLVTESGAALGETIEVELKELTNKGQLLTSNAQTVADGKLLVSGGAYFIGMTSNGERLKLKDGRALSVQFPKLSDKEMQLFYGERNAMGQMNWTNANERFRSVEKAKVEAKSGTAGYRTKRKSGIDAILDYTESGDTSTTAEGRAEAAKLEREHKILQEKAEAEERQQKMEDAIDETLYSEVAITELGWINCDRFLDVEDKTDVNISFDSKDGIRYVTAYLVFKDINSVIGADYPSDNNPQFRDMPVGYSVRLIAYTVKDEKIFAYSTDFKIAKGQTINLVLKEMNEKDFRKLISN